MAGLDVGRKIAGKYQLVRLIGRGAMGEVWLATHDTLEGEFAIKVATPDEDTEVLEAIARFQLEAQISAKLSRKTRHIVSVTDHGEEKGIAYLVMELLEGESLETMLDREGPLELSETINVVSQVARALTQAHAETILHRDLKPGNLFLTKDEDGRLLVKLFDFGIARAKKPFGKRSPYATGKDLVLGTPSYMSPEQARGLDSLDHRCDVWALGVVAYEMLTRALPWEGESVEDIFISICIHRVVPIRKWRPELPVVVEQFFERAFAPNIEDRFATASDLAKAFGNLLAFDAVTAPTPFQKSTVKLPSLPPPPPVPPPAPPTPSMEDPLAVSLGEEALPKRRRGTWLLPLVAVTMFAVLALVVIKFRSQTTTVTTAPPEPPPPATTLVSPPPPPPVTAPATALAVAPTPEPPRTRGTLPRAPVATTPRAPSAAPSPPAPAPPPPPAPTRKPVDKSEVF